MKAVHCLDCNAITPALPGAAVVSTCRCGRHSIWSVDARGHQVAVLDRRGARDSAYLLRISNDFLRFRGETNAAILRKIINARSDPPHFRDQGSVIVQTDIATHEDSGWADRLPAGRSLSEAPIGRRHLLARLTAALWG